MGVVKLSQVVVIYRVVEHVSKFVEQRRVFGTVQRNVAVDFDKIIGPMLKVTIPRIVQGAVIQIQPYIRIYNDITDLLHRFQHVVELGQNQTCTQGHSCFFTRSISN